MYGIHPALPAYLAAQWRAEDPDRYDQQRTAATTALLDAHVAVAHSLKEQIDSGDAGFAYAIIDRQRRTLGYLLGHALGTAQWEQAFAIVEILDGYNGYWRARGLFTEADAWSDRARLVLEQADGTPPVLDSASGELWLFLIGSQAARHLDTGQLDAGEQTYQQILEMLTAQPETAQQQHHLAVAYHQLGNVAQMRGRLGEAENWYRRSLAIKDELGDWTGLAASYYQLGIVAEQRGSLDEAEDWYRRSLAISEQFGNRPGLASGYHGLGNVSYQRGRLSEAEDWYRQARSLRVQLADQPGLAATFHGLGQVAQDRGRLGEAEDWYRRSLMINEELGGRRGLALTYHQLGILTRDQGRLREAEDWYRRSLTIFEQLGDQLSVANTYWHLGIIAQLRELLDEAEDLYRRSLAIFEQLGDQSGVATSYHGLGNVAYLRRRLEEAEDWYRRSLTLKEELGDRPGLANTYGQLGLLAEQRGRSIEGLDWTVRCVALFDQFPHPSTGPGPDHLARLTAALGVEALQQTWQQVTGQPLPADVLTYVQAHRPSEE
jgi:tetratricopeptide (TPR) repeat protein